MIAFPPPDEFAGHLSLCAIIGQKC